MAPRHERDRGGGLSPETLIVASLSSVTAMLVVSHFWRPGTVISAALTPVIVALTSELLRRPAKRVTRLRPPPQRSTPAAGSRPSRRGDAAGWEPSAARTEGTEAGPVRIYRRKRRPRLKVALITGLVAFVIAALALTVPELIFGGSVSDTGRTTLFGGAHHGSTHKSNDQGGTQTETQPGAATETQTTTTPTETTTTPTETVPTTPAPTQTTPTTPSAQPPAQTAPAP